MSNLAYGRGFEVRLTEFPGILSSLASTGHEIPCLKRECINS
jgi:hypothetical protein